MSLFVSGNVRTSEWGVQREHVCFNIITTLVFSVVNIFLVRCVLYLFYACQSRRCDIIKINMLMSEDQFFGNYDMIMIIASGSLYTITFQVNLL